MPNKKELSSGLEENICSQIQYAIESFVKKGRDSQGRDVETIELYGTDYDSGDGGEIRYFVNGKKIEQEMAPQALQEIREQLKLRGVNWETPRHSSIHPDRVSQTYRTNHPLLVVEEEVIWRDYGNGLYTETSIQLGCRSKLDQIQDLFPWLDIRGWAR